MLDLLVFTDLDGTLLDHHDYSYEPALPALNSLAAAAVPVIFNSSKTAAEIEQLRSRLDNRHPFIVENGSAVCIPTGYFDNATTRTADRTETCTVHTFGPTYADLLNLLHPLRTSTGYLFKGFADMSTPELAALTGLEEQAAAQAQQRHASEPLLWQDSETALAQFRQDLQECGLTLVKGGRFYHVMGAVDKAEAMRWLTGRYRRTWPERAWRTVALGDSPNDLMMLETADLAVTIPPAVGPPLELRHHRNIICPNQPGPHGWQDAITQILERETDKGA